MLATDLRFEASRTHIGDTRSLDGVAVRRLFDELEDDRRRDPLRTPFDLAGLGTRSADMRYGEQVFEIAAPLDGFDRAAADPLPEIVRRFHRRHEELFTYSLPDRKPFSSMPGWRFPASFRHCRRSLGLPTRYRPYRAASVTSGSTSGLRRRCGISARSFRGGRSPAPHWSNRR